MFVAHDAERDKRRGHAKGVADLLARYHKPKTVIDLGCGKGFFLAAMAQAGAVVTHGVDGPWVKDTQTEIAKEHYTIHNLENPYRLGVTYDLCACLEVAEHVSVGRSEGLVDEITALSDYVLFSAAIPGQRGKGHINCQWQESWAKRFAARGFRCYDPFRRRLAGIPKMAPWFIQNLLFFVREGAYVAGALEEHEIPPEGASYVLPTFHQKKLNFLNGQVRDLRDQLAQRSPSAAKKRA